MFGPLADRGGHRASQRRHCICGRKRLDGLEKVGKVVPVQELGWDLAEICRVEEAFQHALGHGPARRQPAAVVEGFAGARAHAVVQQRPGGAGVKGQQRAGRFGRRLARVDPGEVGDPAEVQHRQRFARPDPARAGEVEERRQRRPLPAQRHIGAAKIPDHRTAQNFGQHRAIAHLVGAARPWFMRQRLAVKPHQGVAREFRQKFGMGGFDHLGGGIRFGRARPVAQPGAQNRAFARRIGAAGGFAELQDARAVAQHHRRVNPVQRSARHRAKRPDRSVLQHMLFLWPPPFPCAPAPV